MEHCFVDEIVIRNNEIIEICMNDEIMEENVSVLIKANKNLENEREERMKINL
jgi:hypothetical protein